MVAHRLTRDEARRIAIHAQLLAVPRPTDLVGVVERLTMVQLDPTAAIAPSADLVLWSRLGPAYHPAHLTTAIEVERTLVETVAYVRPPRDLPAVLAEARAATHPGAREWIERNESFRRDILALLAERGPLLSRDIPDTSVVPWPSSGWTNNRNVTKMLELLARQGQVAISGRKRLSGNPGASEAESRRRSGKAEIGSDTGVVSGPISNAAGRRLGPPQPSRGFPTASMGRQRYWDLPERVYAVELPDLDPDEAVRRRNERRLAALGIARSGGTVTPGESPYVGDAGEEAVVEGVPGTWRVDPAYLGLPFEGRTALLSPFDRLIHDRVRTEQLFGFEYFLEMYKPRDKRRWGYFALPVLHHDRLVGKLDATADRKAGTLVVNALHEDVPFTREMTADVDAEIENLATWLGLTTTR
ncbi:crosslink repair DNA glycosylase YcaQ family protein [Micromonospora sp. WMMD1082]|uniref:DNA glycosylase AlkZ-like family protein n=1 Tax=Micromonospora sp. WMMD1082 TaxID=3016104 RepID=UPI00241754AA|nr:crosslink repair DNA glycosylase YcaQ family protein [Micromonospora sp. WMMD1082]MDG4796786.1 crosslink repair DNA glycosylase YcaQ family protein [Micromonospora sp. WMMD1082]